MTTPPESCLPRNPTLEKDGDRPKLSESSIQEQAFRWASLFDAPGAREVDDATAYEFHQWLIADPRHVTEYRVHAALAIMSHDISEEVRERLRERRNSRLRRQAAIKRWFAPPRLGFGAVCVALVLALVFAEFWMPSRWGVQAYSTKTAETRSVHLPDGSDLELNSQTRVQWSSNGQGRWVDLLNGEVYVGVAPEVQRPFRVRVGLSEIRALGTRFDVYKKSNTVLLTVVDGTVEVAGYEAGKSTPSWVRRVSAPHTIEYRPDGVLLEDDDLTDAQKWLQGIVQFRTKPLDGVVEDLSRYTDRSITYDARLTSVLVTGIYKIRDVRGDFTVIARQAPMTVHDEGNIIKLRYKDQETSPVR